jgi:hypothetical protein
MLKSEIKAWFFLMIVITIFLHNMLHLMVGHLLLPTTLTIFTHINHVHIAPILIIVLVIVHPGDKAPIFHMSKWTQISPDRGLIQILNFTTRIGVTIWISRGKLKLQEIMLFNTMNCTILNILSSITYLPILHPTISGTRMIIWRHSQNIYTGK